MPATRGIRAARAFCINSKEIRPETKRKQPAKTTPRTNPSPITLSRALWRPTSSEEEEVPRFREDPGGMEAASSFESTSLSEEGRRLLQDRRMKHRLLEIGGCDCKIASMLAFPRPQRRLRWWVRRSQSRNGCPKNQSVIVPGFEVDPSDPPGDGTSFGESP